MEEILFVCSQVQVVGLLCRTPQKESRHELLRRVAAGGGVFKAENGTKVHLPGANLNEIANQADDLLEVGLKLINLLICFLNCGLLEQLSLSFDLLSEFIVPKQVIYAYKLFHYMQIRNHLNYVWSFQLKLYHIINH